MVDGQQFNADNLFSMIKSIFQKYRFDKKADRIGPDIPFSHWKLYFKPSMLSLCISKFKKFDETAEFRPGAYAICCSRISIGKRVIVRPNCMFFADSDIPGADIIIDDDVMMGSGVHIYVTTHKFDDLSISLIDNGYRMSENVVLHKGCWLGANIIVLPGVEIGENSVIGAGSVVTRSIPKGVLAVGNPAKVIREIGKI
jgi:acetyltransferase-like isoleucine patch superfamily enzyme